MFGEDLFPPPPSSAKEIVASFRRFVAALPDQPEWSDSHWSAQADLLGVTDITYSHIGRVEAIDRTVAEVGEYVGERGSRLPELEAENRSFLPYSPALFDRAAYEAYRGWTEPDSKAFGYEPLAYVEGEPDDRWHATVEANIPAIRMVVEQNQRFLDLWHLLTPVTEPSRRVVRAQSSPHVLPARARVASPFRRRQPASITARLVVAAIALVTVFVLLPEVLGDRPHDPRPSGWPAAIENQ